MRNSLFAVVSVAVVVASAAAYGCGDGTSDSLSGARTRAGGTSSGDPAASSGGTDPNAGSSGTVASSGGLTPADTSGTPAPGTPPPAGACIPPDVQSMLSAKCVGCHSSPPVNGSLSALVTLSDLLATAKEDATKNEAQLSLARMQNAASPMPPTSVGNPATAAEITALQTWIAANYVSSACNADSGAPPPAATDVFTGAPAFVSQTAGGTHNAGKNCMGGCHNHGFTFAGTVTNGAGQGVGGAEVRLVDANNKAISVYTGSNGNFHSSSSWVAPAKVGVRNAAAKVLMVSVLQSTQGGCNGCHITGGTQSPIHIP
jgi:hypothetical protein